MDFIYNILEWLIENNYLKNGITFLLTISILMLAILTIYHFLAALEQQRYVIQNYISGKKHETFSGKFLPLPGRLKNYLNELLRDANIKVSPQKFLAKYVLLALVVIMVMPTIAIIVHQNLYVYMSFSIGVAFFLIYHPIKSLRTLKDRKRLMLKLELPEYLDAFALLLKEKTLYQTTIQSEYFAGETLKPFIQQLIIDIKLNPGSKKPYMNFASQLEIEDVETFMQSVIETIQVDQLRAQEIINEELQLIEEMREDTYTEVIEKTGSRLSGLNFTLIFPVIALLFVFMFYTLSNMLDSTFL